MARPFRFQPPSVPERALRRPRLLAQLAHRWDRRLITVVAGPGFGKTALLVAAMNDKPPEPAAEDVWLSCEPSDESAEHLAAALTQAFGLSPGADIDAVLDRVWGRAPAPVCLVLDDVHEIPTGSKGAALLERVVGDLPRNGHVVLSSRDTVPVPTARLAASGQLLRVREDDLVLDQQELEAFAQARDVDPGLLASTGGWPALAELTASAGADLVLDYLWEEVLTRVGAERAHELARLAMAGGGDDEVASAVAGHAVRVDELIANVPLVARASTGWAALHPLWEPALRRLLSGADAAAARRAAAAVHRRRGRLHEAIDLLAEAEAWEEVLAVVADAAFFASGFSAADFGRWHRLLPQRWRGEPVALLAEGLDLRNRAPLESIAIFDAAAEGFRAAGDVDGEVAALGAVGLVLWWANDPVRLMVIHQRVVELAATGSPAARFLQAVGMASVAHLMGDSAGVFAALAGVDNIGPAGWRPSVQWLRSVAHRREGDLEQAFAALGTPTLVGGDDNALNFEHARLRTAWLNGDVEEVCARLPELKDAFAQAGDRWNAAGASLELAAKTAWLGQSDVAGSAMVVPEATISEVASPMVDTMRLIAEASIAIAHGDEEGAAQLLHDDAVAMIGQPNGWYWRDRAAVALVHVLVPETRPAWETEPLGPPHRIGLALARVLEATRDGDLGPVADLRWPEPGAVRAHLPLPWVVELAAAGVAAGNPPPEDLLSALGDRLRPALRTFIATSAATPVAAAAKRLVAALPTVPQYRLRIEVLGPLALYRDDESVTQPELRRQRVRELLCYLVARRRAQREAVTDDLWPELDDRGHNLRVTLNYLQQALQPERLKGDPPYFLTTQGPWLALVGHDRLEVDVWELEARLDEAVAAERANAPATALAAYRAALPSWRGEPYADLPYTPWAQPERTRLQGRYTVAALRAGELLLAAGDTADARDAAERALAAEPTSEPAYQLMARAYLADDNLAGARRAIDACRTALAELDLEPEAATLALLA